MASQIEPIISNAHHIQGRYYIEPADRKRKKDCAEMVKKVTEEIQKKWGQIVGEYGGNSIVKAKLVAAQCLHIYHSALEGGGAIKAFVLGGSDLRRDANSDKKFPPYCTALRNLGCGSTITEGNKQEVDTLEDFFLTHGSSDNQSQPKNAQQPPKIRQGSSILNIPKMLTDVQKFLHQGSILNESSWWILINDWFMLGAMQSGKPFHIAAFPKSKTDEEEKDDFWNDLFPEYPAASIHLWDNKNERPTAFGRELYQLISNGYRGYSSKHPESEGIVLTLPSDLKEDMRDLSFLGLREQIMDIPKTKDKYFNFIQKGLQLEEEYSEFIDKAIAEPRERSGYYDDCPTATASRKPRLETSESSSGSFVRHAEKGSMEDKPPSPTLSEESSSASDQRSEGSYSPLSEETPVLK